MISAKKTVVADASPLIAFGRINLLSVLSNTLGMIIIPQTVADECLADITQPGADQIKKAITKKLIKIQPDVKTNEYYELLDILGKGEAAAIALALKLKAGLLIDEKLGRNAAKKLHLKIIGTAGVLLLAKQHKLITKVSPIIQDLKNSGYYLSTELMKEVLIRAKEKS